MSDYIPYGTFMTQKQGRFDNLKKHPEKYYVPPVRIAGRLWYVGYKMVCMHTIDTGCGLIRIDAG